MDQRGSRSRATPRRLWGTGFSIGNALEDLEFRRILKAAKQGDGRAFEVLFTSLAPRIRGFAQSRGAEDPDGTANEVMLRAFRSINKFRGSESAFTGWVFQIARNTLIDESRKRARRIQAISAEGLEERRGSPLEDTHAPIERWHDHEAAGDRVQALLQHLSPDQADIVAMRAITGLSYDEIAEATGKRVDAVRAAYRRGRVALESLIELESVRTQMHDVATPEPGGGDDAGI